MIKINKLVQLFILSDLLLLTGWGFVEPIFAVFILSQIKGATLLTVGWAVAIYLIAKSTIQIPIAIFLDRFDGESDDFYALVFGLLLLGTSAFLLMSVSRVWEFYVIQIVRAFGMACYAATWPVIFSKHLDPKRQSFEWSLDGAAIGIGAGVAGLLGSVIATSFGYHVLFGIVGTMSMISAVVMLFVPKIILPRKSLGEAVLFKHRDQVLPGV